MDKLSEDEFAKLKASTLISLKEPAKNLREEVGPLITDWYRERFSFDSKQQLIAAVEQVTLADVKAFYRETMLNDNAARISVQMRGTKFKEQPFADLPGQIKVDDVAAFHVIDLVDDKGLQFLALQCLLLSSGARGRRIISWSLPFPSLAKGNGSGAAAMGKADPC